MASHLRRTDDLQRLKVRELVLQGSTGSYAPASSILTVDGIGNVITGATGAGALTIYTNNIRPYPIGSTGPCNISGRVSLNNRDTNDGADVTLLEMIQSDAGGTGGAIMYVVGEDSVGFGGTPNDRNQFCTYVYPKPARAPITKVESTPLMAGTVGPVVGLTGAFGDKYFYGNVQVGGYVATSGNIVSGKGLRISEPTVPGTTGATGSPGQIAWDTGHLYVCVGANSWKRAALFSW